MSAEDIFIQLIIEETDVTLDEPDCVIKYLNGDLSMLETYNKCIGTLESSKFSNDCFFFKDIDRSQVEELKQNIVNDETVIK